MAKKNYIGTTYLGAYGGAGGSTTTKSGVIKNGTVTKNATAQGASSSYNKYSTPTTKKKTSGTGGLNLTTLGYPSSTEGYTGGNVSTTKVNSGSSSGGSKSSGYTSSYSSSKNYDSYDDDYSSGSGGSGYDSTYDIQAERLAFEKQKYQDELAEKERLRQEAEAEKQRQAEAYAALVAAYEKQQREREEYLRQQKEAAQNAYNKGMGSLNDAYNSQLSSLADNLSKTKDQLLNSYNLSKGNINSDAESSLRQAYINNMLSQKNLGQQLSAQGLSGGAVETTIANLLNNYGNARNNINTTANNNLSALEGSYNNSLTQAQQAYNNAVASANSQKAQYVQELENALANNQISAVRNYQDMLKSDDDRYIDLLQTAIQNGANIKYNPTSATNSVSAASVQQASNPTSNTNYAALQALLNAASSDSNTQAALSSVTPSSQNYLAQILAQLRG